MTLGLQPKHALLNDANPHLINFYGWLKRGLRVSIPMENREQLFYKHRDRFNALMHTGKSNSQEAAALFYFLNRTGYNGLCRFNSKGEFNVPFGRYKTITYAKAFPVFREILAGWDFSTGDFAEIQLRRDDFVYADPPYDVEFTTYSQGGFSWDDQTRTAEILAKHRGPVILVNQSTPRIDTLYRKLGYDVDYLDAPRRISCNGDRTPAKEIIATRNL